jgi:hypothetical protein
VCLLLVLAGLGYPQAAGRIVAYEALRCIAQAGYLDAASSIIERRCHFHLMSIIFLITLSVQHMRTHTI